MMRAYHNLFSVHISINSGHCVCRRRFENLPWWWVIYNSFFISNAVRLNLLNRQKILGSLLKHSEHKIGKSQCLFNCNPILWIYPDYQVLGHAYIEISKWIDRYQWNRISPKNPSKVTIGNFAANQHYFCAFTMVGYVVRLRKY